jgi:hypothetical protein
MNKKNTAVGRPTKYLPEYNEQVIKLCKLGATDEELADFFNVAESTINLWKIKEPEFSESIKKGKIIADCEEEELKVVALGNGLGSEVQRHQVIKHYPPDTAAAFIWLKNRRAWKDKVDVTTNNKDIDNKIYNFNSIPVEQLRLIRDTLKKATVQNEQ